MSPWLIGPRFDLALFGIPVLLAVGLVGAEPWLAPDGRTSLPLWMVGVLAVDVAHVWATLFVTYLDREARSRHRTALRWAPIGAAVVGVGLALCVPGGFWRVLAYVAVFHFIRQQYGWVRLYHRRQPRLHPLERRLDLATVYAAALYPLLWWHAHLPRRFVWFAEGDFVPGWVSPALTEVLRWPYLGLLFGFAGVQVVRQIGGHGVAWGKVLVVAGTAVCWGLGIVGSNSDWAFTVTNVFLHGLPYMGFVWFRSRPGGRGPLVLALHAGGFYLCLLGLAYAEEWGWDRLLWHEGGVFHGPELQLGELGAALALGLLSVPQLTHYLLDGLIWRRPAPAA